VLFRSPQNPKTPNGVFDLIKMEVSFNPHSSSINVCKILVAIFYAVLASSFLMFIYICC